MLLPPPPFLFDHLIHALQAGTVVVASAVFHVLWIPAARDGYIFSLREVAVEVSPECSGIRSMTVLVIFALLAGHFMLRSLGRQVLLLAAVLVIAIAKNALRIVALTAITAYLDPNFLDGSFHKFGGIPLLLVSLAILYFIARSLQQSEHTKRNQRVAERSFSMNDRLMPVPAVECRERKSSHGGFWFTAMLAAALVIFAGSLTSAVAASHQSGVWEQSKPEQQHKKHRKAPEAGSLLLLGSSLLSAGGALLLGRRRMKSKA